MQAETPISSDLIRGHIDTMILRVLSEGDNYGYEIIKSIFEQSNGKFELKEPSLYTSLKRLEKQKLISAYWGDESQGGRRKYYKITPSGERAYEEAIEAWAAAKKLIDQLIVRGGKSDE
ncbi:PadR family transcriptional regulator [Neobacillus vireti]|uniref:Transcriptional regulator n=1 Tax=Neobacillus vireti LMG 21834 TaxID=1131730 RepID=A0AB94IUI3_9BACI|nr:PadR family transcriptional regulator [Neobacillus vireti]ETI70759.1 transcriptional regulator [Neobacillus vireti LMG 21834]KLT17698.1 PadR family transcriptional regulator [Neobacillus vireti]